MATFVSIEQDEPKVEPSKNLNQAISSAAERAIKKIVFSLVNVYRDILQHLYNVIGITMSEDKPLLGNKLNVNLIIIKK